MTALRVCALVALSVWASACGGEKDSATDEALPEPLVTGTITAGGEASAQVAFYKAFGFDQGGRALFYLSSSPFASCDSVTKYLQVDSDPYDPAEMFQGGHCNMFIRLDSDYDGDFEYTRAVGSDEANLVGAGTSLECAMGQGDFELTRLTEDDRDDYYWTGRWWQGRPSAYTYDFDGTGEGGYTLTFNMTAYDGGFIHEELDDTPADGAVTGTIEAEYCASLGSTGLF